MNSQKSDYLTEIIQKFLKFREMRRSGLTLEIPLSDRRYWIDWTYVPADTKDGKKYYGPYYRLRWIESGKKKCKYLGKAPKEHVHLINELSSTFQDLEETFENILKLLMKFNYLYNKFMNLYETYKELMKEYIEKIQK